jgi:ribonuclease BN (tRNA processing enzyme)
MEGFARGADLLVHEAMLADGVAATVARIPNPDPRLERHILRSHTPAHEVGRLARAAGVRALALNHFVPDGLPGFGEADWTREVRRQWDGPLQVGRDGMRIALP